MRHNHVQIKLIKQTIQNTSSELLQEIYIASTKNSFCECIKMFLSGIVIPLQ